MHYLDFLKGLHRVVAPPTYLEIGIRHGDSLALARARSVGIDPAYKLRRKLGPHVKLFRETSDEYFARSNPLKPFRDHRIALSFIDGMHLAEFVVRDFANVERHAHWSSVIVFDDMLPRSAVEAARDRRTRAWTGDVYKAMLALERHRPDLICLRIDTQPTGLGLVLGLDPASTLLRDRYDDIVGELLIPDPQDVPDAVLTRAGALDPQRVLAAPLWERLRDFRAAGIEREAGLKMLNRAVQRDLGVSAPRPLAASRA